MLRADSKVAFVDGEVIEVVLPPELIEFAEAVDRFRNRPRTSRPGAVISQELIALRRQIDLTELEFAKLAAEFAATNESERCGAHTPAEWIRHECHMSVTAASSAVCVGEQITTLPETLERVETGKIGFSHLALLAGTARAVRDTSGRVFDETPLLNLALEHSVSRFRYDCANARHAADAAGFLTDHLEAVERRYLELKQGGDGYSIRGWLDTVGGATVRAALEPLARRAGKDDLRPRGRRMADAAIELANHQLDSGNLPAQAGQRPHLQVTTTLETLMGLPGAAGGHMQFAAPVPASTVQRIACDSGVTRVLFDSQSAIIDVGRSRRVPSAPVRRALEARDKGCVWPGCDRPPAWTNAHHLKHWAHNGSTDISNLILVCLRHHGLLHEEGWRITKADDGRWLTVPPLPRVSRMQVGREAFQRYAEIQAPDAAAVQRVREFWDKRGDPSP